MCVNLLRVILGMSSIVLILLHHQKLLLPLLVLLRLSHHCHLLSVDIAFVVIRTTIHPIENVSTSEVRTLHVMVDCLLSKQHIALWVIAYHFLLLIMDNRDLEIVVDLGEVSVLKLVHDRVCLLHGHELTA